MAQKTCFPLGVARGEAFCNRVEERKHLVANIRTCTHSLIVSPRRYGKTSLVEYVLRNNNWPYAITDFLLASDSNAVENIILECVGRLSAQILPLHKRAMEKALKFMSSFRPRLIVNAEGPKLELLPDKTPKQSIKNALMALDSLVGSEKKQCVIVMDEFQQIATIKGNLTLEASIRHAVERSENVSYIFSGSQRNLLLEMFDFNERPLYRLCDQVKLDRISDQDYILFIKKAFAKQWKKTISDEVILMILELTHRHSYYVNFLCSKLIMEDVAPTLPRVKAIWDVVVEEDWPRIVHELSPLSPNQRAVLLSIAKQATLQPSSKEFLSTVRLSAASAMQAFDVLRAKDLIYQDAAGFFRVLNPVVEYVFLHRV